MEGQCQASGSGCLKWCEYDSFRSAAGHDSQWDLLLWGWRVLGEQVVDWSLVQWCLDIDRNGGTPIYFGKHCTFFLVWLCKDWPWSETSIIAAALDFRCPGKEGADRGSFVQSVRFGVSNPEPISGGRNWETSGKPGIFRMHLKASPSDSGCCEFQQEPLMKGQCRAPWWVQPSHKPSRLSTSFPFNRPMKSSHL